MPFGIICQNEHLLGMRMPNLIVIYLERVQPTLTVMHAGELAPLLCFMWPAGGAWGLRCTPFSIFHHVRTKYTNRPPVHSMHGLDERVIASRWCKTASCHHNSSSVSL